MAELLTEQAIAERLGPSLAPRFCQPGALPHWLIVDGGQWTAANSTRLLWTAVIGMMRSWIAEGDETVPRQRRYSIQQLESERGFRSILKMLEQRPELQASPADFEPPDHYLNLTGGWIDLETGVISPPASQPMFLRRAGCRNLDWLQDPIFHDELRRKYSGDTGKIAAFIRAALSRDRSGRRILHQDSRLAPDLNPLLPLLQGLLGDYLVRLSYREWSRWPDCLDAKFSMRFLDTRLVFLDAAPSGKFPPDLLERIIRSEEEEVRGMDGSTFTVRMPTHYVLLGSVSYVQPWAQELLPLMETISGPRGDR